MIYIVFKCGHAYKYGTNKCEKCNEQGVLMTAHNNYDGLKGRKAISRKYKFKKAVKSSWDLPGFRYRPDMDTDLYM